MTDPDSAAPRKLPLAHYGKRRADRGGSSQPSDRQAEVSRPSDGREEPTQPRQPGTSVNGRALPPSWFAENVGSGRDGPYKEGLPARPCAVQVDGTLQGVDLPLILTDKERKVAKAEGIYHFYTVRLNSNIQAPGLALIHHHDMHVPANSSEAVALMSRKVTNFMISPDQCDKFEVTTWHTTPSSRPKDEDEAQHTPIRKSSDNAATGPPIDVSVVQIQVKFKSDEHPLCRIRGKYGASTPEAEARISALADCTHLKIIMGFQKRCAQVAWYREIIKHCMQKDWSGMGTFWSDTSQYASPGTEGGNVVDVMIENFCGNNTRGYPDFPGFLRNQNTNNILDAGTLSDKPLIATRHQWVTRTVVALLREAQYIASTWHSVLLRQMRAVRVMMEAPTDPQRLQSFDISRLLLGHSPDPFKLDVVASFQGLQQRWNGDHIGPAHRIAIETAVRAIRMSADAEQGEFLEMGLHKCSNGYLELTGSPGSGKTWTVTALAVCYALYDQLTAVCATSNRMVDELVGKLLVHSNALATAELGIQLRFVRIYHISAEQRSRLCCDSTSVPLATLGMKYPQHSLAYLTMLASDECRPDANPRLIRYREALVQYRASRKLSLDCEVLTAAAEPAENAFLRTCHVIFATANAMSLLLQHKQVQTDVLCMDGVSQMTVPQYNQAIQGNSTLRRVVAVGDPEGFGPRVQSMSSSQSEYGRDLSVSAVSDLAAFFVHDYQKMCLFKNHRNPNKLVALLPLMGYSQNILSCRSLNTSSMASQSLARVIAHAGDSDFILGKLANIDFGNKPFVFFDVSSLPETKQFRKTGAPTATPYASTYAAGRDGIQRQGVKLASAAPVAQNYMDSVSVCERIVEDLVLKVAIPPSDNLSTNREYAGELDMRYRPECGDGINKRYRETSKDNWAERAGIERGQNTDLEVTTIDQFQGSEADFIIVDLRVPAEQDAISWVGDSARVVSLLTRTKQALFIVGDWDELMRMKKAPSAKMRAKRLWTLLDFIRKEGNRVSLNSSDDGGSSKGHNKRKHQDDLESAKRSHQRRHLDDTPKDRVELDY